MCQKSAIVRSVRVATLILSLSGLLPGQSKYAGAFENFKRTRDPEAFAREIDEAESRGIDLRVEVPFLVDILSSSSDQAIQEKARFKLFGLAYGWRTNLHPLVAEVFRPAVAIFERHLDEAEKDENSKWAVSIIALTAFVGLPPSTRAAALMYRMVDYKDERDQALALLGLARLKPLPNDAKQILFSRMVKTKGKTSGPPILAMLAYAIDDVDVQQTLLECAAGQNLEDQRALTLALSSLSPPPTPSLVVLRRFEQRKDLNEEVQRNVKAAIDRIENKLPVQDKE